MSLALWNGMRGARLPTALDHNSNKWQKGKGQPRTGKSDRCQSVGSAVLHRHGQGDRREEGMSKGEWGGHIGIKKINNCVTCCVQGSKISVCCWQGFYGGFLLCLFGFFFNAYITLPQTDNSSQPLWQSGNPADPLLCILLAWAPWHFLRDSSGDLRTCSSSNAHTDSQ